MMKQLGRGSTDESARAVGSGAARRVGFYEFLIVAMHKQRARPNERQDIGWWVIVLGVLLLHGARLVVLMDWVPELVRWLAKTA